MRSLLHVLVAMVVAGVVSGLVLGVVSSARAAVADLNAFDRSKAVSEALVELYWNDGLSMFNNQYPCNNCNGQFHYWWQAHGIDALLDAYELTGDEAYAEYVNKMYNGLRRRNGGHLFNDFYDDQQWMALALLRAHLLTGDDEYLRASTVLWNDISNGWNDHYGGGISWRKSQRDYKNTPSNAPASILATRLYNVTGDESYLDWAKRLYTWLKDHMVDPDTGIVWDGINRTGDGQIDKGWIFTYNQGTFIGAGVELWRATGEESYLNDAKRTADAVMRAMTVTANVFPDEGQGDGGLFKGILVRYLGEYIAETDDEVVKESLRNQADAVWRIQTDQLTFGPRWYGLPFRGTTDLSTQLSATMLFSIVAKMDR